MSVDGFNLGLLEPVNFSGASSTGQFTVAYRYAPRTNARSDGIVAAWYDGGGARNSYFYIHHRSADISFGFESGGTTSNYATYAFTERKGPHSVVCVFDYLNDTRKMFYDGKDVTTQLTDTGSWANTPNASAFYKNVLSGRGVADAFNYNQFPIEDFFYATQMLTLADAVAFHHGAPPTRFNPAVAHFTTPGKSMWDPVSRFTGTTYDWPTAKAGPNLRPRRWGVRAARIAAAASSANNQRLMFLGLGS